MTVDRTKAGSFLFSVFVFSILVFSIQMPPAAVDPLAGLLDSAVSHRLVLSALPWGLSGIVSDGSFRYGNLSIHWDESAGWTQNTVDSFGFDDSWSAHAIVEQYTVAVIGQTIMNRTFSTLRGQTVELTCQVRGSAVEETSFDQAQLAIRFGREAGSAWTNVSEVISPWVERSADFKSPWFCLSLETSVPDSTAENVTAMRVEVRARELSGPTGNGYVDDVEMTVIDQVSISAEAGEVTLRVALLDFSYYDQIWLSSSLVAVAQGDEYVDWAGIEARLLPYHTYACRDITEQWGTLQVYHAAESHNQSVPTREILHPTSIAMAHLISPFKAITRTAFGMIGALVGSAISSGTAAGTAILGDLAGETIGNELADRIEYYNESLVTYDGDAGSCWGPSDDSYTYVAANPAAHVQYVKLTNSVGWMFRQYHEEASQYALLLKGRLFFRPSFEYVELAVLIDACA